MSRLTLKHRWSQLCLALWPTLKFVWGAIVLGFAVNIGSTLLTTKGFNPQGTSLEWMLRHPVILLLCVISLLILTLIIWNVHRKNPSSLSPTTLRQPTEQNRSAFLHLLQNEYRRQLMQSLHGIAMMTLEMQERTDIIQAPAQLVSWRTDRRSSHISIIKAYDEASQGLLILGAPGSGKSTLLRDLASGLLKRAENDLTYPLPVIFNLSSWANKKQSFQIWLVEQLQLVYALPRHLGYTWIKQGDFLLLLDGLDEVEASARAVCIEAINTYRKEHFVPLVVCSRSREYIEQIGRLQVPLAVEVQPLTYHQVEQHLKKGGKSLAEIRLALKSNIVLHDLITTPLMLSVIIVAYHDKTVKDVLQFDTAAQQQQHIFASYIQQMLDQSTRSWDYSSQQTYMWLIRLAQHMKQDHQTDFYLETLQPSWLPTKRSQYAYQLLAKLLDWLFIGLIIALFLWLVVGPLLWIVITLLLVAFAVTVDERESEQGIAIKDIQPFEKLTWGWKAFGKGLGNGLFIGLSIALGVWLTVGKVVGTHFMLPFAMGVGLISTLSCGLLFGLVPTQINEYKDLRPNQRIHISGWNAFRIGILMLLVIGLASELLFGLKVGTAMGLGFGLAAGLWYGGQAYFQHYILRIFLWKYGIISWRYVHFLNEATDRILLQRVGGGYRFIHPLFQDYFASLPPPILPLS